MKKIFLSLCIVSSHVVFCQNSSVEIKGDIADLAKLGRTQGAESLPSYSSGRVKGSRYLFENWLPGSVTTTNNETITNRYFFMFDKQNNDLYVKQKDSPAIILIEKSKIKKFILQDNRIFIEGIQLEGGEQDKFYQLLNDKENKYGFYKLMKTKFIKASRQDAERIKNGDFDDEYKDEISYYIKPPNQPLQKIKLSQSSITKILPSEAKKISSYCDAHSTEDIDEQFVHSLIDSLEH